MKRRTLLRRVGATGMATVALGSTSTAGRPASAEYDVDREIDVSAISGHVALAELLDDEDLDGVPDHIDPDQRTFTIAPEADSISLNDCCFKCVAPPPCEPLVCNCFCCESSCTDC